MGTALKAFIYNGSVTTFSIRRLQVQFLPRLPSQIQKGTTLEIASVHCLAALSQGLPIPPAASTSPLFKSVALWFERAVLIVVMDHVPALGS